MNPYRDDEGSGAAYAEWLARRPAQRSWAKTLANWVVGGMGGAAGSIAMYDMMLSPGCDCWLGATVALGALLLKHIIHIGDV